MLVPKCTPSVIMKDLRLISLCEVAYKILAKVLANQLKLDILKIISKFQSAFVSGQSILDYVLIAFEVFHYMSRKTRGKEGVMALKIDISKAYDRID